MKAARLRELAAEMRGPISRQLDDSEILSVIGRVCREEGIDYAQLKALIKAQIRDERGESGEGECVAKIIERADNASAYADLLANMNEKNISRDLPIETKSAPIVAEKPVERFSSPEDSIGDIPPFLDRRAAGASA